MKHKRILCALLALALLCSLLPIGAAAEPAEEGAPASSLQVLQLSSLQDFLTFAENCRLDSWSRGTWVVLQEDLDLTGLDFEGIPTFGGYFDGRGHTIRGLKLTGAGDVQGLFRYIQPGATVRNLTLQASVQAGGTDAGALVGQNSGHILGCSVSASVSGTDAVGGIAGTNDASGIIENCTFRGDVHGNHFIGGIAGQNNGVIRSCENTADVNTTAPQNTVRLEDVTLENITNTEAAVTSTDFGGIAGNSAGVIRGCINRGAVGHPSMGYNVGGIVGSQTGFVTECENYGAVYARKEAGGIVGQMEPCNILLYSIDTLQVLRGQLDDLSSLTNAAGNHASYGGSQIAGQISALQGQANSAANAIQTLVNQLQNGGLTDPDSMSAAFSTLSTTIANMGSIAGKMGAAVSSTTGALVADLRGITGQIGAISDTVLKAEENLGASYTDISDQDTEADTQGKVSWCVNYAPVAADRNGGGIVGAMSTENDMDPEDDFEIIGELSMNVAYDTRAVVRHCRNEGTVTVKKQGAGGISGSCTTGVIFDSVNTGAVLASGASEVGGITGSSSAIIRRCDVKCQLQGSHTVGGIAGIGATVTDCRALVQIQGAAHTVGGILGSSAQPLSLQGTVLEAERTVKNNFYLPVGADCGAVDGISYDGCAQSLSQEQFLALENLPDVFRQATIRFCGDGMEDVVLTIPTGGRLVAKRIPEVPARAESIGCWQGLEEFDRTCVLFDTTFTAAYTAYTQVLASDLQEQGKPLALAQGSFSPDARFCLESWDGAAQTKGSLRWKAVWQVQLSEPQDVRLRYQLPQDANTDAIRVYICDADGQWRLQPHTLDASYAVFDFQADDLALCIVEEARIPTWMLLSAAGIAAAAILAGFLIFRRKKGKQPL